MMPRIIYLVATLMLAGCFQGEKAADAGGQGDSVVAGTAGGPCYGNKTCNTGLVCKSGLCVKGPDGGSADSGPEDKQPMDTAQAEASAKDLNPDGGSSYMVMITEIMADPGIATDSSGEWFEIFNLGSVTVNIHGWTISTKTSKGTDTHKINASGSTLNIKPNHYLVIGAATDIKKDSGTSQNGGVPVDYSYSKSKVTLGNDADSLMLYDDQKKQVDRVDYDQKAKWLAVEGASMSLKSVVLDNNLAANWCKEKKAWSTSAGDFGSPGMAPDCGP